MPLPETYKSERGSPPTMHQVNVGAYVSLRARLEKPTIPLAGLHPRKTTTDASYDRVRFFRLFCSWMTGLVGNRPLLLYDSCCVFSPWDFSSGSSFTFSSKSVLAEVLSSQILEHLRKKVVHLYRSTRPRTALSISRSTYHYTYAR